VPYHTVQGKMRNGKIIPLVYLELDADVCVVGRRSTSGYSRTRRTAVLWYFWYEHSRHHPYKSVSHFFPWAQLMFSFHLDHAASLPYVIMKVIC
jgi:hypothetical protein